MALQHGRDSVPVLLPTSTIPLSTRNGLALWGVTRAAGVRPHETLCHKAASPNRWELGTAPSIHQVHMAALVLMEGGISSSAAISVIPFYAVVNLILSLQSCKM